MVANQFCNLGKNRFLIKINPWSYNVLPKQKDIKGRNKRH